MANVAQEEFSARDKFFSYLQHKLSIAEITVEQFIDEAKYFTDALYPSASNKLEERARIATLMELCGLPSEVIIAVLENNPKGDK